ncbi:hypothetical protein [Hymenobacter latericus]|uniref:hypothetical protein n=1 Tax=Hymenobacter sp. YIM 151858-1 TaxID=2987688 RepID=UPI00222710ED|nr:hypothetical protein [Hymenobacter sp. YIM 151858-1]UYZ57836.1 hypothetical protein OIS50_12285 [Hymenobacter sp. YIM 151858-1]
MHITHGFHTVEDRGNIDYVKRSAPFKCARKNAWLSHGFYFWEKDLQRAKDWGEDVYGGKYLIGRAELTLPNMLDLVGDREHQEMIQELSHILQEDHPSLRGMQEPPLAEVITLLRKLEASTHPGIFPYDSVKSQDNPSPRRRRYVEGRRETTDLHPRIQICLFEKNARFLQSFRIVYPEPSV